MSRSPLARSLAPLALLARCSAPAPGPFLLHLMRMGHSLAVAPCADILCDDNIEMVPAKHALRRHPRPLQSFSMLASRYFLRPLNLPSWRCPERRQGRLTRRGCRPPRLRREPFEHTIAEPAPFCRVSVIRQSSQCGYPGRWGAISADITRAAMSPTGPVRGLAHRLHGNKSLYNDAGTSPALNVLVWPEPVECGREARNSCTTLMLDQVRPALRISQNHHVSAGWSPSWGSSRGRLAWR